MSAALRGNARKYIEDASGEHEEAEVAVVKKLACREADSEIEEKLGGTDPADFRRSVLAVQVALKFRNQIRALREGQENKADGRCSSLERC